MGAVPTECGEESVLIGFLEKGDTNLYEYILSLPLLLPQEGREKAAQMVRGRKFSRDLCSLQKRRKRFRKAGAAALHRVYAEAAKVCARRGVAS